MHERVAPSLFPMAVPASGPHRVRIYCDESGPCKNTQGEKWMYMGLLVIPEALCGQASSGLRSDRDEVGCDSEIHFSKLRNDSGSRYGDKTGVARRWVCRVLHDRDGLFHLYVLGLSLSNITHSAFGRGSAQERNMYSRFFRSAISYALKSFFRGEPVMVTHIFHDRGPMETHDYFDWHAIWRVDLDEPVIAFERRDIDFIDSDHQAEVAFPNDSHFIQLCDVLLGGFRYCLDGGSQKAGCCEIAQLLMPLAERLTDKGRARNTNSRYNYAGRVKLSFFPSKKLSAAELDDALLRSTSTFYVERSLLLKQQTSRQIELPLM
jgi:hypothetical protein